MDEFVTHGVEGGQRDRRSGRTIRLPEAELHYLRYDAPLEFDWLEAQLGMTLSSDEIGELRQMNRPALAPRLLENRRSGGAKAVILPEHFL